MIEQVLLITGAAIFGVLGTIHLLYTFYTDKFMARNREVTDAMKKTSPVLTSQTTMWRAWIGFNASHSLGAIFISVIYIVLAVQHMEVLYQNKIFITLTVIIGLSYLYLAKQYWFRIPFTGILLATCCFIFSALLIYTRHA